jgi:hypothetical protein
MFLLVVGGKTTNKVELVSMDSEAKPIPECLQHLREFPSFVYQAAGAALLPGKISAVLFCFLKDEIINSHFSRWRTTHLWRISKYTD